MGGIEMDDIIDDGVEVVESVGKGWKITKYRELGHCWGGI